MSSLSFSLIRDDGLVYSTSHNAFQTNPTDDRLNMIAVQSQSRGFETLRIITLDNVPAYRGVMYAAVRDSDGFVVQMFPAVQLLKPVTFTA